LGKYVGNAVESYECIKILRDEDEPGMQPTRQLAIELTARMLVQCNIDDNIKQAAARATSAISSGEALERFRSNIELQGGDPTVCDRPRMLFGKGIKKVPVTAIAGGFVTEIDTFAVGRAICDIGGGRVKAEDDVDHAVGFECVSKLGDQIAAGDTIGIIHCRSKGQAGSASEILVNAYKIAEEKPNVPKLIRGEV
jgi:thymidine phosphorylase